MCVFGYRSDKFFYRAYPDLSSIFCKMYVCTCRYTQHDTRHDQVESGKLLLEEEQFNTTYVLEESMDLANVPDMKRDDEVVCDPLTFLFSDAMSSSVTSRGSKKFSTTFSSTPSTS
jgi:hypothetical protein